MGCRSGRTRASLREIPVTRKTDFVRLGTPFERDEIGAMAEQLGSGLQNRVHRCDSGSRLGNLLID